MRTSSIFAALMIAGCASSQKPVEQKGQISVSVQRVLPKAESLDASGIEVTLRLENPVDEGRKIDRIDYEIDTGDVAGVVKGSTPTNATIEANQAAELSFSQSIKFPEEEEAYKAVLARGTIPLAIKGAIVLGDGTKLTFDKKTEIATPTLPQFIVFDAQAARYEKEGLDVTLFLRMVNENVFPVTIESVRYTVFVADKKIKSEQAIGVRLLQGGAEEYEVTTILDGKSFEKGKIKEVIASRKIGYKVSGKIDLPRLDIPFEHVGEIELAGGE
jgi:LEA14-like dessication related protein